MPFTRPSILLPQSVYFDINRQFALSGDGGQLYGEHRTKFGDFYLQINVFNPRVDDPDLNDIIAGSFPGEREGKTSWGGRLIYEKDGGRLRLAISGAQLNTQFHPDETSPNLQAGSFGFDPVVLSAQFNAERWALTAEYALRYSIFEEFGPLRPDTDFTGESFYLQGTYRFSPHWEGILRYDQLVWDRDDRNGQRFEELTGQPAHSRFAKDWTVGLKWDVNSSFMLRTEYHLIDGTGWLSSLENQRETERYWSLFSILGAYRF
jgi:hypothetical protein